MQTVIKVSWWVADYWWALVPVLGVLAAADFAATRVLVRRGRLVPAVLLVVGIALVLFAAGIATAVPILISFQNLNAGLNR
jgi:hypothetical protein